VRKKLKRFRANANLSNLFEQGKPGYETLRGRWADDVFGNARPLIVELGCGSGEFTAALAERAHDHNHVGVDKRGARMFVGGRYALEQQLTNVAFLRTDVTELERFFAPDEIDTLWLTFPDPRPKTKQAKHRLTAPPFLDMYRRLVGPGGWVRFKTDDPSLFDYTLGLIRQNKLAAQLAYTDDLHQSRLADEQGALETRYEKRFRAAGLTIKYLQFQFVS
tara:strand:- start:761 stop:1420 length:660 start_codon:yes stop_codon:yes gene_type:complete